MQGVAHQFHDAYGRGRRPRTLDGETAASPAARSSNRPRSGAAARRVYAGEKGFEPARCARPDL